MYQVLVFIHIVSGVIWVGGAFFAQLLAIRSARSDDPNDIVKFGHTIDYLGQRVFLPASIVLFIAGAIMVAQQYSFGQLWVSVAMGLWIVSALAGSLYLGPRSKKAAVLFEAEGPTSVGARTLMDRVFLVSRLELLSFAVILALMVYKPGAGVA